MSGRLHKPYTAPATIANGAAVSATVALHGKALVGVKMSAGWTAADIGVEVSMDDSTWTPVAAATGGTKLSLDAAAAVYIPIDPKYTQGALYARITSLDTSDATAENQGAERLLLAHVRRVE